MLRPLATAEAERVLRRLLDAGVEAIAVCLLHSYANPAHEQLVKEVAAHLAPGLAVSISAEVLPEIKEYERTSTTVINAYVRPIVERYLARLISALSRGGIAVPLLMMQSNGGLMPADAAAERPIHIIETSAISSAGRCGFLPIRRGRSSKNGSRGRRASVSRRPPKAPIGSPPPT